MRPVKHPNSASIRIPLKPPNPLTPRDAAVNDQPAQPPHDIPNETIDLQIADVLAAVRYPANKDAIVDAARDAGASNEVLSMLDGLPEQDYADVNAVTHWVAGNFGPGLWV
ncbi:hypothetical protein BLA50215_04848 [Burkholderia lata]|nr:hypothetical protein BLA50215_04848 [Burkholderia lata]